MTDTLYDDAIRRLAELRELVNSKNTHIRDLETALREEQARSIRYKSVIDQSAVVLDNMATMHSATSMPDKLLTVALDKMSRTLRGVK